MSKTITKGYTVRKTSESPTVPCPCGQSTRILTSADEGPCSVHVTRISDSVKHYHRLSDEVYYILHGFGKMELNDDTIDIEPGMVIHIEAGTRHRLASPDGVTTLVIAIPPFDPNDEWFDTNNSEARPTSAV